MIGVILCGGTGNRLWPLSRKNYSKQFLRLINDTSLLQDTYLRIKKVVDTDKIFVIGNKSNFNNILKQIKEVDSNFDEKNILIEPCKKNTAPAIALMISYLKERGFDQNEKIVFLPSDHYIPDFDSFGKALRGIDSCNDDGIITIGVKPTKPETGYGYIKTGEQIFPLNKIDAFKEKPNFEVAVHYYESGEYLWNSGIYIFSIEVFLEELKKCCNEIYSFMEKGYDYLYNNFSNLPSISIDYAVSEKSDKMYVYKIDFRWYDVGTFDGLDNVLKDEKRENNNNILKINSNNVFAVSKNKKFVVCTGVDDINVIETDDCLLIQKKGSSNDLNTVIKRLEEEKDDLL